MPSHKGLVYVGSWEDRTLGLASFSRPSRLSLERGVYVSGPATIEEIKRDLYFLSYRVKTIKTCDATVACYLSGFNLHDKYGTSIHTHIQ
jgi:hypothetical protein